MMTKIKINLAKQGVFCVFTIILFLGLLLPQSLTEKASAKGFYPDGRQANPDGQARDFCSNPDVIEPGGAQWCISGYMAGYAGEPKDEACPPDNPSAFILEPCQKGYDAGAEAEAEDKKSGSKEKNEGATYDCDSFVGKDKENCKKANERAGIKEDRTDGTEDTEDSTNTEDTDCQNGGVMGWILCPVFELGANVTSDAFESVIRPMLENIPVSTQKKDPFYKAWSNFRMLGNIVLVGAMMVLVYGQIRGGGR